MVGFRIDRFYSSVPDIGVYEKDPEAGKGIPQEKGDTRATITRRAVIGEIMKKLIICVMISLFFFTQSNILLAHEEEGRGLVADVHLERGKAEADVALVRLSPHKMAAIVKIPVKSEARVKKLELVSPCGKIYKASSVQPMPSNELKEYLDQHASGKGVLENISRRITEFLVPSAYASCGSCGGGGSSSGHGESDSERAASFAGFGMLMGGAIADASQWFTVCIFEFTDNIVHTIGEWKINLLLDNQGRTERLNGQAFIGRHPGIGHMAGVPKGGTFYIVTGDADEVIGDFALPYRCCSDCAPVEYIVGPSTTESSGNRALTSDDLNATREYLDGQSRNTTGRLTGSGIVSGLEAGPSNPSSITVTPGMGVSSAGHVIGPDDAVTPVSTSGDSHGRPSNDDNADTNPGSFAPGPEGSTPVPDTGDDSFGRVEANEARDTNPGSYHVTR